MPEFGKAHKFLSARHKDTQPPAEGADPDDGQIPTWSTALKAWVAAAPAAAGVTDHGLLTGLGDDDHPQYAAIAQNENISGLWRIPNTTSLRFGHAAGPTLAGLASGDQLTLSGDQQISGVLALKGSVVNAGAWLNASPASPSGGDMRGLVINPSGPSLTGNNSFFAGVIGAPIASIGSGSTGAKLHALDFFAGLAGGGGVATVSELFGVYTRFAIFGLAATVAKAHHLIANAPFFLGGTPAITDMVGVEVKNMGGNASIVDSFGLRIANMTANTGVKRLIEAGPVTPFFRVEGGTAPTGENSMAIVNFGGTLYRLIRDAATGVVETAAV